jgi:phosphatidylglycerol:prolipoprotein diacylglycerol transferase
MRRFLFEVPGLGFKLPGFGLMFLFACFGALALTAWRARRERLNPEVVFDLAIWLMTGGFIGARVLYILMHPGSVQTFADLFKVWQGGIVFYGCIIGGLIGSLIYWYRHPFPFLPMADAVAPSLVLGLALGRVGCWLNGCCYGAVCQLPWAVRFPEHSPAWTRHVEMGLIGPSALASLPVHPTQFYSVLDGLILLGLLTAYYPRRRRDGEVMALLMVGYGITRFLVELLRADEGAVFAGLTLSQNISLGLFLGGLAFWRHLGRKPPGRYADDAPSVEPVADSDRLRARAA